MAYSETPTSDLLELSRDVAHSMRLRVKAAFYILLAMVWMLIGYKVLQSNPILYVAVMVVGLSAYYYFCLWGTPMAYQVWDDLRRLGFLLVLPFYAVLLAGARVARWQMARNADAPPVEIEVVEVLPEGEYIVTAGADGVERMGPFSVDSPADTPQATLGIFDESEEDEENKTEDDGLGGLFDEWNAANADDE